MILKCEHVTKQFGKLYAVDDLSFEVEEDIIFYIPPPYCVAADVHRLRVSFERLRFDLSPPPHLPFFYNHTN